ncbi:MULTISPECIES: hypothetical protein [Streptomyces]|uniref:hypothetical protein n=2 Tax=[Kitasatospora] papulosa TaxID=1464011 RepID=UPI0018F883AB
MRSTSSTLGRSGRLRSLVTVALVGLAAALAGPGQAARAADNSGALGEVTGFHLDKARYIFDAGPAEARVSQREQRGVTASAVEFLLYE